jgi:hypothetical protein
MAKEQSVKILLDIIANLIILEDHEAIEFHMPRLKCHGDEKLLNIIQLLKEKKYSKASKLIKDYLASNANLEVYTDPELAGLRFEAHSLEKDLSEIQTDKADLEKQVHYFNVLYQKKLGHLIEKLHKICIELFEADPDKDEQSKAEHENLKEEYERYRKLHEQADNRKVRTLTPEDQEKIKKSFRKASRLIHPDTVPEKMKKEAEEMFIKLKSAYNANDLDEVERILESLKGNKLFVSKSKILSEKESLFGEIEFLHLKIAKVKQEIDEIKNSKAYKELSSVEDIDKHLDNLKEQFEKEIAILEKKAEEQSHE